MENVSFVSNLLFWMGKMNITGIELAKRYNCKPPYISQLISGKRKASKKVEKKIIACLDLTEEEFYKNFGKCILQDNCLIEKEFTLPLRRNNDNDLLRVKILKMICVMGGKNLETLTEIVEKFYLDSEYVKKNIQQ